MDTNKWEKKPNEGDEPPYNRYGTIVYHNRCIIFTGNNRTIAKQPIKTYKYYLDEEFWENISNLNETTKPRISASGFIFENYFYIFFGFNLEDFVDFNSIIRYDLTSNSSLWEEILIIPEIEKESFSLSFISDNAYIFAGYSVGDKIIDNKLAQINLKTKVYEEISNMYIYPDNRYSGTLSVINTKLYLFGGKNSEDLFNDMWIFHTDDKYWESLNITGDIPSARHLHSSCTEGDALLLWGGEDFDELKNDLFIFNSLTNYWTRLYPSSTDMPRAAKAACIVSKIPKVYIYGGITNSGYSGELWEFDMGSLTYKLISKKTEVAYHTCELVDDIIYIVIGFNSADETLGHIDRFNLTSNTWEKTINSSKSNYLKSKGIQLLLDGTVIIIGGRYLNLDGSNKIWFIDNDGKTTEINYTTDFVYSSNYAYYKSFVYSFSGGISFDTLILPSFANSLFFTLDLNDICSNNICNVSCSKGSFKDENICKECSPGYYSEGKGNTKCTPCPAGTYNKNSGASSSRQCYPCPENTFTSYEGSSQCYDCPINEICPSGGTTSIARNSNPTSKSIQPPIYSAENIYDITLTYQIILGMAFFTILALVLYIKSIRKCLKAIDIYVDQHNQEFDKPMTLKKNTIGGSFSLIFLSLAVIFIGSTIIQFELNNIVENKGFVPLLVLNTKVNEFSAPFFYINTSLYGYRDNCSYNDNICSSGIIIDVLNIEGLSLKHSCVLTQIKSCSIMTTCLDCKISSGAKMTISLTEYQSFASGIEVNITSDSSIPNNVSSFTHYLYSKSNYVFIGSQASQFYFTVTPSFFTSESSKWKSDIPGYHISSEIMPSSGSQYINADLPIVSQVKVQINFEINSSGLLTQRLLKQTWLYMISGLLGSVFGIKEIIGVLMSMYEEYSYKCLTKFQRRGKMTLIKDKRKILTLSTNNDIYFKKEIILNTSYNGTNTKTINGDNKIIDDINIE